MPKLTIDNRTIEVPAGTKVIQAAEQLGIVIPRFCYHPALGSVGACRVCGVAFLDGPVKGIQMSCMVNAQDGMVVSTTDDEAVDFRRHVIEWLMLNHPHDCPVCDEGGHCLLQDLTVAGGHGMRRYRGLKRTHNDQYLGPLVQHEMNRCIQCYRCARYYQEFAGSKDLGVMGIGTRVYFGRSAPGSLESAFAGNLIDICPTGVYTDKPSRFMGRRWDFQRSPSVCLHCSLGCNLTVSARYRRVVRQEARSNLDVNGHFICDRGRYGYPYADDAQRPRQAMVDGEPREVSDALAAARRGLTEAADQYGSRAVAAVGSVRSSLETLAALVGLCEANQWRGPVVMHEKRRAENLRTTAECLSDDLVVSMGAVSVAETVVVIGADPLNEAPMLALSLRQAQRQGGYVAVIDPRAIEMPLAFDHLAVGPSKMSAAIRHLIHMTGMQTDAVQKAASAAPEQVPPLPWAEKLDALATRLVRSRRAVIVCGTEITTAAEIGLAAALARTLRGAGTEAKLFYPLDGPNAFAAARMGDNDISIESILDQIEAGQIKALLVVENDLWRHCPDRDRLTRALGMLERFILLDYAVSPLVARATTFIPTQTVYEAGGRWINQEGRLQSARPVLAGGTSIDTTGQGDHPPRAFGNTIPEGAPAAAWRLVSALWGEDKGAGPLLPDELPAAVLDRIASSVGHIREGKRIALDKVPGMAFKSTGENASGPKDFAGAITLLLVSWTFGTDALSSGSSALAQVTQQPVAAMHSKTAGELGLGKDDRVAIATERGKIALAWRAEDGMAPGVVVVPRHHLLDWQVLGGTRLALDPGRISAA